MLYIYIMKQQTHIYKYVQSHNIILQQHVLTTLMAINRVSCNNNTIGIQIIVQKCVLRPFTITFYICQQILCS
jgi:hypothetical protein